MRPLRRHPPGVIRSFIPDLFLPARRRTYILPVQDDPVVIIESLIAPLKVAHCWIANRTDVVGSDDLTPINTPLEDQSVAGLKGGNGITSKAMQYDVNTTDSFDAPGTSTFAFGGTSKAIYVLVQKRGTPAAQRDIAGDRESTSPNHGWELGWTNTGAVLLTVDGTGGATFLTTGAIYTAINTWHVFCAEWNATANEAAIFSESQTVAAGAVAGSPASSRVGALGSARNQALDLDMALAFTVEGSAVETADHEANCLALHGRCVA